MCICRSSDFGKRNLSVFLLVDSLTLYLALHNFSDLAHHCISHVAEDAHHCISHVAEDAHHCISHVA